SSGSSTTPTSKGADQSPPTKTSDAGKAADGGKTPDPASSKPSDSGAAKPSSTSASRTSDPDQPISDPNRPILRRGKPDPNARHDAFVNFDDPAQAGATSREAGKEGDAAKAAPLASVQTVAAISDAGGPDP